MAELVEELEEIGEMVAEIVVEIEEILTEEDISEAKEEEDGGDLKRRS